MQTHALADADFTIPPCPARDGRSATTEALQAARGQARAARRWLHGLGPVQEASLVGIVSLLAFWSLAELALKLQGF
jgi:hypothetical protein